MSKRLTLIKWEQANTKKLLQRNIWRELPTVFTKFSQADFAQESLKTLDGLLQI